MNTYLDLVTALMTDGHVFCFLIGLLFLALPLVVIGTFVMVALDLRDERNENKARKARQARMHMAMSAAPEAPVHQTPTTRTEFVPTEMLARFQRANVGRIVMSAPTHRGYFVTVRD